MSDVAASETDPRIGTTIAGRYLIRAVLGAGGMGTVYRADDQVLRMPVAVKLLRAELASNDEVVARFDREAQTMTALAHENIVRAMSFGKTREGDLALVMELIDGEMLRLALNRLKPFALPLASEIIGQLGAALQRAHEVGVIHRDLKPENVMIAWSADGRPTAKVMDFGMARIVGAVFGTPSPLTRKGAVFGTPEYMPPEQAVGMPVDSRGDQYAFGVMVFEMLAGQRPFRANDPIEMLRMQVHAPAPTLRTLAPHVTEEISDAVLRMMSKRVEDRFPDVRSAVAAMSLASRHSTPGDPAARRKWWQVF